MMGQVEIRSKILHLVSSIEGIDLIEREHIDFACKWIESGSEIFRITKPATPDVHLCSYFVVIDQDTNQILLTAHKKSGLWLPPGGHVETNEHPKDAAKREAAEELGIAAQFLFDQPIFLTVTQTIGQEGGHTDVSLWFVLQGYCQHPLDYDKEEFNDVRWFRLDELSNVQSDPHIQRFVRKLEWKLTQSSYESSAAQYAKNILHLHPKNEGEKFCEMLPDHARVLDLGCGSGRDAKIFSGMGLEVIGIDFSPQMIEIARQTSPQSKFYAMNLENLDFPPHSFQGVWANSSILHVPKNQMIALLSQIHKILMPDGVLYLSLKKGSGEVVERDHRYGGLKKFWSFFQEIEVQDFLEEAQFKIHEIFTSGMVSKYETHPLIKVFAKK